METGDVVGDRFQILDLAGTGGMGRVYRARDRKTGALVALKVLASAAPDDTQRFLREGSALRRLENPNIVRFVESGTTPERDPFLAMEWIEGEDLACRLARGPLDEASAIALARPIAEALGAAHAAGLVHRDVKPTNVLLPGGRLADAKLADFGIARSHDASFALTRTGHIVGTPRFMAPEQVRGADDIDSRADVFALGCLLYECLAGKPAFDGPDLRVVFAKILFDEAPRLSWARKDVSLELDRLVSSMLARDAWARPADGAAVAAALAELATAHAPTMSDGAVASVDAVQRWTYAVTAAPKDALASTAIIDDLRATYGRDIEVLRDGTIIIVSRTKDAATDGANAAARCALSLLRALPEARVTLSANRTTLTGRSSFGDLLERALVATGPFGRILVDEHVASLLDARFKLAHEDERIFLEREDALADKPRTLLGRPTPTVGREREIATLRALFDESREESVARAALVTAAPGIGKSRLRHELLHDLDGFEIWSARADALVAGAPHLVAARLVRDACGANAAEGSEETRKRLRERIGTLIDPAKREHTLDFLVELVGASPEIPSRIVASARNEASIMAEQIKTAWETFVEATCRSKPLLIAIEDLHWGDLPTVKLLDSALRRCRELPLVVIAFARPEIERTFPGLWAERSVMHHRLAELSTRACKKLVHHVLGEGVPAEMVEKLVALSTGNALYLEELIRSASLREGSPLPPTIVALMEARLDALAPEARRLLQAGSVFGETFWLDGARALLPIGDRANAMRALAALVESELLERHSQSRFANDEEVGFRHALVREAAYASLADPDRRTQHADAARWLIAAGETDAFTLAEHFERAGRVDDALPYFVRAAREALRANDFTTTQARCRRGLAAGATGPTRRDLLLLQGESFGWQSNLEDAAASFDELLADPAHASDPASTCDAIGWQAIVNAMRGLTIAESDYAAPALSFLLSIDDPSSFEKEFFRAAKYLVTVLYFQAAPQRAEELVAHVASLRASDPSAAGWRTGVAFMHTRFCVGDVWRERELGIEAYEHCSRGGDILGSVHFATQTAFVDVVLGCSDEGLARVEPAIELADRFGIRLFAAHALPAAALCAAHVGDSERARRYIARTEVLHQALDNEIFGRWGLLMAAMAARRVGDLALAERWCAELVKTTKLTAVRAAVHIGLGGAVLDQGRPEEAFNHCLAAIELTRQVKLRGTFDLDLFDTGVRALRMMGMKLEADQFAARGRRIMEKRAAAIEDEAVRARYLALPIARTLLDG